MHAHGARPAMPLAGLVADQLQRARLRGGGVGVAEIGADVVAALVVARHRDRVQRGECLQLLRQHQFVLPLVPAAVDPAPLEAAAHAEAGVGADERAAGVDRALCRRQLHGDVDHAILRLVDVRQHVDHREVVGPVQGLLQDQQLVLGEVVAGLERHVAVEEAVVELRTLEVHPAVAEARARIPCQPDRRAVVGAVHLDAMGDQARVEEAVGGELGAQRVARVFVGAMVEGLALESFDRAPGPAQRGDLRRGVVQLQFDVGDLHRFARLHVQGHVPVPADLLQLVGDGGVVIAVGSQRRLDLVGRAFDQAPDLGVAHLAFRVLRQLDTGNRCGLQRVRHAIHRQLHAGVGCGSPQQQRQQQAQASWGSAHAWGPVLDGVFAGVRAAYPRSCWLRMKHDGFPQRQGVMLDLLISPRRYQRAHQPALSPALCAIHAPITADTYGIDCAARMNIHKVPSM